MNSRPKAGVLTHQQRTRFAGALQRVGGDEEMLIVLAEMAAEDAPVLLTKLEGEIEHRRLDAAAHTAHALKGLLSTFETDSPVEDLQPLIEAVRENDGVEAQRFFRVLKPDLNELVYQVRELTALN